MKVRVVPEAWLVECPPGREFEAMVFTTKLEAEDCAVAYMEDTDSDTYDIFPLHRGKAVPVKA